MQALLRFAVLLCYSFGVDSTLASGTYIHVGSKLQPQVEPRAYTHIKFALTVAPVLGEWHHSLYTVYCDWGAPRSRMLPCRCRKRSVIRRAESRGSAVQ